MESLPTVDVGEHGATPVATVLSTVLEFAPSSSAARRIAKQNGLRLVVESGSGQQTIVLDEAAAARPLREVVAENIATAGTGADAGRVYLKAGRRIAQLQGL
jgi:tyrosyl-tRNA synthetase